ncbi:MAG: NAD-dependent deacylase [bacterium]|nr:NAD-dependent deacylase [bacterium]
MNVWGTDGLAHFYNTEPMNDWPFKITKNTRITALCGAGISAESGVPTYRGSGGLWNEIEVQEIATSTGFLSNPERGWEFYHERRKNMGMCKPNPGHEALAKLEQDGYDIFIVTQNIDGLQQRAGSTKLIEIHGSLWKIKCSNARCKKESQRNTDVPIAKENLKCDICGSWMRPDVVFFQEMLNPSLMIEAETRTRESDLFFVIGTSGTVYPAAGFAQIAKALGVPVIEFNIEETLLSDFNDETVLGPSGETLPKFLEKHTGGEFKF